MSRPVALITGGGRGIGAATSKRLAKDGYDVLLTYNTSSKPAEMVVEEIRDGGGNGSIIGRNTFQRPREEALEMLNKVIDIYKFKN